MNAFHSALDFSIQEHMPGHHMATSWGIYGLDPSVLYPYVFVPGPNTNICVVLSESSEFPRLRPLPC